MNQDYRNSCQVFTPTKIVKQLLDWCGYNENIYGRTVMENSCGEGNILVQVIKRYIEDAIKQNIPLNEIKRGLENDIYGIEYDGMKLEKCLEKINKVTEEYGIDNVKWKNIIKADTLKTEINEKFDYIVGNPPYIKYKTLKGKDREYIRKNFRTCRNGKFDYCYAFIEKSIDTLKDDGKMAYLVPNSVFKNVFANDLREYMKQHIQKIYDYTTQQLFDKETNDSHYDRITSSTIMILGKNTNLEVLEYEDVTDNKSLILDKERLGSKWIFSDDIDEKVENKTKFSEYFIASNTIATLYNEAYIINDYEEDKEYIYVDGQRIERKVIKDTISPKNFNKKVRQKIIFPYHYKKGELVRYTKEEFENEFPGASNYLRDNYMDKLAKRDSDKGIEWFEYGRSQALRNSNQRKLLLSTVITNKVRVKLLGVNNIPYSGIYITAIGDEPLEKAEEILKSDEFYEYVKRVGIHASRELT